MYKSHSTKVNYTDITDKIIKLMEAGTLPMGSQWSTDHNKIMPFNLFTDKMYRGINILHLWVREFEMGFTSNGWITINQLRKISADTEKPIKFVILPEDHPNRADNKTGQRGTQVFHAGNFIPGEWRSIEAGGDKPLWQSDISGEYAEEGQIRRAYLKVAGIVFNLDQIANLPEKYQQFDELLPLADREPEITAMTDSYGVPIKLSPDGRCYYKPGTHTIHLVHQEQFATPEDFERVKFHELVHSTGHESETNRLEGINLQNKDDRAREELVAELGAAFMCAQFGIPGLMVHAEYIEHYINVLKKDNRAIFKAAAQAQVAVELLLSHNPKQQKEEAA